MPRGGKREGAGRKPGIPNRSTREREEAQKLAALKGISPLEYVLNVLRDPNADEKRRDWAAATALPYTHHRLVAIEGNPEKPVMVHHEISQLELARRLAYLLYMAANGQKVVHEVPKSMPKG